MTEKMWVGQEETAVSLEGRESPPGREGMKVLELHSFRFSA